MKKTSFILLSLLFVVSTVRADFSDGMVAYQMGDYETAYNTMISLASTKEEDPLPQYILGVMYLRGQGVEQNYEEAGKWFRKASENRLPQAQYKLATLYTEGKGVPRDYEFAYVWYSVGAAHNHKLSVNSLDKAREKLSDSELKAAEKLLGEYVNKYGPSEEDAADPQEKYRQYPDDDEQT